MGTNRTAYTANLTATGGRLGYTWSIPPPSSLPNGLSLNATNGQISGTPTTAGNFTFMYRVTDNCSQTATKNCTIVIYKPLTCNQTTSLPCLYKGKTLADTVAFSATGGQPPYAWVLTPIGSSSALPNGLLQKKPPNGVGDGSILYGTITENGTYNFTATVTDSLGNKCSQNHTIVVYPKLEIATPSPLPVAYIGSNYSATINSTTGNPCYSWTLNSTSVNPQDFGNLNITNGTCDSSILSGIPKKVGNYTVVVVATDSCGQTANKTYSIEVKDNKILSCLKEIWVVVDDPYTHACNRAAFDIFANGVKVMVASVNNIGGPLDWANGGGRSASAPSTFIFPHRENSSSGARWNEVLIDGALLNLVASNAIGGIVKITASGNRTWSSSNNFHDPIGRLRVYTSIVPTGSFLPSNLNLVFDTSNLTLNGGQTKFGSSIIVNTDVCKTIARNSSLQTLSTAKAQPSSSLTSQGVTDYSSMALIYTNNIALNSLHNSLILNSSFKIGNYEITNQQYADFLNAIAKTDPNNLYNSQMSDIGIQKSSNKGPVSYSVDAGLEDYPVACVSWFDAARYANWMANGKPTGAQSPTTTENGVYNLGASSIVRNAINPNTGKTPTHWLLNEREWYTSAYLKSDATALWAYPTQSNTAPDANGSNPANLANFGSAFNGTTPVGFFDRSPGPFGTFDQAGNVREWTESLDTSSGKSMRIIRGGSWADPASSMRADESHVADPNLKDDKTGFRIGGAP